MKTLSGNLAAHLATGATTLCHCWRLERADGALAGFTDHDRPVSFGGLTYEAVSGFTASAVETSLGLNVDDLEVIGALTSLSLNEDDLAKGLYDNASVILYRVNWAAPDDRLILRSGNLGEVSRAGRAFKAEVRGLAHHLNQPVGRLYQYGCDADLGDARCTVNLAAPAFAGTGTVTAAASRGRFTASGLESFASGRFDRGRLDWQSGANAGLAMEVKAFSNIAGTASLELWREMPEAIAPGDSFTVTAGCDKQLSTCKAKFANIENFRGFPHMPGNDFVQSYPSRSDKNDGGSRFS